MTLRSLFIIVGIVTMLALDIFLISEEHVEKSTSTEVQMSYEDKLGNILYTKSDREKNLEQFGLSDVQIKKANKEFLLLERMDKQLQARLEKADTNLMAEIFCPRQGVRPRFAAARVLIIEKNGNRSVLDPKTDLDLEEQNWSLAVLFSDIYEDVARSKEDLPQATVLTVGAFLVGEEEKLSRREPPWGRALDGSWNWEEFQQQYPKSIDGIIDYLVLMHYLAELANDNPKICQ